MDSTSGTNHLLTTALVGALLPADVPEGRMMRSWLSSWTGIGHVTMGRARQDYDLQLTRYGARGRRTTFFLAGPEHFLTRDVASAYEATPWRTVQRAALGALGRIPES